MIIEGFLGQVLECIERQNGQKLASLLVLNFDNIDPDLQQPYQQLHQELNSRFPATKQKEQALQELVEQKLPKNKLHDIQAPFTNAITSYFCYVRDFASDTGLSKARKIESITKKCITALRDDQPGPTMISVVLYLTNILRQISINLDRDPELRVNEVSDDDTSVSYVEQSGNTLREAFMKIASRSNPNNRIQRPGSKSLLSGLYQLLNSCMRIYLHAGKIRNAESILQQLELRCPPIAYYPAAQRVTFLYYLGVFYFTSNQFYRALLCFQNAYDQSPKRRMQGSAVKQREMILCHLFASSMCLGRLPSEIMIKDTAAIGLGRPFAQLVQIIKTGDVGRFVVYFDHSLPEPMGVEARWFLRRRVLMQLKNRGELLCWRSLVYRTMKYAGFLGVDAKMPFWRLAHVHYAAKVSYQRARDAVFQQTGISLFSGDDEYVDPEFTDSGYDSERSDYHDASGEKCVHGADYLALHDPTMEEVNSIVLSLISQGLLKAFIQHDVNDLGMSRCAIPGAAKVGGPNAWKEQGFPSIFEVLQAKEIANDADDVPGWVTEQKAKTEGGRVIHITGAKPVGM